MKVYNFFEQSGTFKKVFKKYGYEAFDCDIKNDFCETDFIIDLFNDIHRAFVGQDSFFDSITSEDLIFAFFPCVRFTHLSNQNFKINMFDSLEAKLVYNINYFHEVDYFYRIFSEFVIVCLRKKIPLIIENPYRSDNILNQFFYVKPVIIDYDRTVRGDNYVKPTMFYFFNIEPKYNIIFENPLKVDVKRVQSQSKVQRSIISEVYADRFVREFIL